MSRRGDEVGAEEEGRAAVAYERALQSGGMAVYKAHGDSRENIPLPFGKLEHAVLPERKKVVGEKTRPVPFRWGRRGPPVLGLDVIAGTGKRRHRFSVQDLCRSAGMVEMQVREYHVAHSVRRDAVPGERGDHVRSARVYPVDRREFLVELPAVPGVDEHGAPFPPQEQRPGGKRNSVLFVGGICLFPERFRDDAEHRPPVERETAGFHRMDFVVADVHRRISPPGRGPDMRRSGSGSPHSSRTN